MLLGFTGFTANGVSFCAVVSRLTFTTRADPAARALKLGVPGLGEALGSWAQATQSTPALAIAEMDVRRGMEISGKRFVVGGARR